MSDAGTAVLVTGASRGIGRATALALAAAGHDLVLWARTGADLAATATEARARGVDVRAAVVDVGDPAAVDGPGRASLDGLAALRAAVVNAGWGEWGALAETPPEQWRGIMATNLDGAFHSLQVALPLLLAHEHPQVVAMASDSSRFSYPQRAAYCASKAGFLSLMETLRHETRAQGLRVTNLLMSRVDTHFRGKQPGGRPSALSCEEVAGVVLTLLALPARVEVRELALSSITSTYGPYPETASEERFGAPEPA